MSDLKVRWALFADENEVTTRHRGIYVYEALREMGWDAGPWDREERADIIVCQYSFKDQAAALTHAPVVVQDINDMVWMGSHPSAPNFNTNLRKAHAVVAGTEYLAERLQQKHPFVRQIHDVVHPMYRAVKKVQHEGVNILYTGMNDNAAYFSECDMVLKQLVDEYNFKVHFVIPPRNGRGKSNAEIVGGKPYPTEFHEWSLPELVKQMTLGDIAWVPLVHTAWTYAKSPNKCVQFMAGGLATMASDVPVYRRFMQHGVDSYLCRHPEDWLQYGRKLLSDVEDRTRIAEVGREAWKPFAPQCIAQQWANLFEEIRPR